MINSIKIYNFKCFKDQTIEFNNLTLLAGLNGMGKSTVLQALLLLRQSYQKELLQNTGLLLNGEFVEIGTAEDALYEDASEEKISFTITLSDKTKAIWFFEYDRERDILKRIDAEVENRIFSHCSLFTDDFHYLHADRIVPRTTFDKSEFLVKEHKQLGIHGEYIAHFLECFGKSTIAHPQLAFPSVQSHTLSLQVEAWLNQISPGTRLDITDYTGMDLINLRYSFTRKEGQTAKYRATNVGFGITYTLPIIVALLSSSPDALVLLENPEAHLHPQGQAKIGELIARAASCGIQVVVETHSDHVLNGIRVAVHQGLLKPEKVNLHFFQRAKEPNKINSEIISPKIDQDGRLDQWPDGFFDEWDKSLDILLAPNTSWENKGKD